MTKTVSISDNAWNVLNRIKADMRKRSNVAMTYSDVLGELEAIYDANAEEYWKETK